MTSRQNHHQQSSGSNIIPYRYIKRGYQYRIGFCVDTPSSYWSLCYVKMLLLYKRIYFINKLRFGILLPKRLRSFSNSAIVSCENLCPFHVLVLVMNTQHSPSG